MVTVQDASEAITAQSAGSLTILKIDSVSSTISMVDTVRFSTPSFVMITERGEDSIFCFRFLKFSVFGVTDILTFDWKVAVTFMFAVTVILQMVSVVPAHASPSQPIKTEPDCGVAVTVTIS